MGKDIDIAGSVFKNGYAGVVRNAQLYVSENLLSTAVASIATNVTADDTIVINGVTWTAKAVPSAAGEFDIGANVDATRAIMENMINGSDTGKDSATGYFEVSAADRAILDDANVSATNDDSANTLTVTGAGRLVVSETFTDGTDAWSSNAVNCYFGKKGAIDLVVQDMSPVDMRETDDRRGTNVFSSYLAGIKTFTDGSKQFLNVAINAGV